MAVRTTMADIIATLRLWADDKNADDFSDQELQDVLDQRAYVASYEETTAIDAIESGSTVYKEFQAERQYFEADAILTNGSYDTLTPDTADYKLAYFTFTTSQDLPVLIYGWWYDINAAAADCWDLKAAKWAGQFDFSVDGGSYQQSQRVAHAKAQATAYRAKSATSSEMGVIRRIDVID